jgi:hypothetical protein
MSRVSVINGINNIYLEYKTPSVIQGLQGHAVA